HLLVLWAAPTGCTHLSHASPDVPSVDHGEQAPVSLDEHDGSWLAAISGPAAEAGADPSGEGERAGRMWIFLSLCPAFEGARDGFEDGLIGGREQVLHGPAGAPVAVAQHLLHLERGDQG